MQSPTGRSAAWPSFQAWATNQAVIDDGRRFATFDKAADGLSLGAAFEAGLIMPLPTAQQQPPIDPSASVADAMLRHQNYQKD